MRYLRILLVSAAMFAALSCTKDNTILYGDVEMGNVEGGKFHSDAGLVYTVTEQTCDGALEDGKRVLIVCDVLKRTADKAYNIRLRSYIEPLCKAPVEAGTLSAEDDRDDPLMVSQAWFGGGYLNLNLGLYVVVDSETKHILNLVHYMKEGSDTLYFDLKHNANGEYYGATGIKESDLVSGGVWACFPMEGLVPAGKQSVPIKLSWKWHRFEDDNMMEETETYSQKGTLVK